MAAGLAALGRQTLSNCVLFSLGQQLCDSEASKDQSGSSMLTHICNPSTQESGVQDHPQQHSEFEASFSLKQNKQTKKRPRHSLVLQQLGDGLVWTGRYGRKGVTGTHQQSNLIEVCPGATPCKELFTLC